MEKEALRRLEKENQLQLDEAQQETILAFLNAQHSEIEKLSAIDTEQVERMVHVLPVYTVVREDVAEQKFQRDDLQAGAPETMDGYWQVPRVVD